MNEALLHTIGGPDWTPRPFQRQTWDAYARGESGLIHAPTGMGKTLAVWGGPLLEALAARGASASSPSATPPPAPKPRSRSSKSSKPSPPPTPEPLHVLWITPLRALAVDTVGHLQHSVAAFDLPWTVELRTGDTTAAQRRRQQQRLPTALVTTPESLSLLLSYRGAGARFRSLRCVVVDEWHELLGSKRGVQCELCLARLRSLVPDLRIWGLSATLGNEAEAMRTLLGPARAEGGRLIAGDGVKETIVDTLLPPNVARFPWSGHIGLELLPQVIDALEGGGTTLLFTNTRSQTEIWFRALLDGRPDWLGEIAVHHGSLDRAVRREVEDRLRNGQLRCVVCTSSLDLGVDFTPVDQVIQIGSPKGVARLLQRAGRSGHRPGAVSRILGVPTNALQLVEFSAARVAAAARLIERRKPVRRSLDLLVQHLVTVALGDGFDEAAMKDEVRSTHAYAELGDDEWSWAMDFVTMGGPALTAYPQYQRVERVDGRCVVPSVALGRMHRMSIGTITSDASMRVRFVGGKALGTIEESFIARLRPGDRFLFAGRMVELVRVRDMTAHVRRSRASRGTVPRWAGGRSPLSTQLAQVLRTRFDDARRGVYDDDEMRAVRPILDLQGRWSRIPTSDEMLIETTSGRGLNHAFLFTFAGRLVNEGLCSLFAHRISRTEPRTIHVTGNDYGLELRCDRPLDLDEAGWRGVLSTEHLAEDLLTCVNESQLARRHFREIARIAGLIFSGYPGQPKATRHLQASSELFFDVFSEFDPSNRLLDQARREVLERELEMVRLRDALEAVARQRLVIEPTKRLTPLAFGLWAETIRSQSVSSERWVDRVQRMALELEKAADREGRRTTRDEVSVAGT